LPVPELPPVIVIQETLLDAVQEQLPRFVVTDTVLPELAKAETVRLVGLME
jgi:hypothetical protein